MDPIKVYNNVNKKDPGKGFGISRMEIIYEKHHGQPDEPHRHDYYTILLVKQAAGKHIIDFSEYELKGAQVYFLAPGQVHQLIETEASLGYSLVFSSQFLVDNNIPASFIADLNLFYAYDQNPPILLDELSLERLLKYCEEMEQFNMSDDKFKEQAIGAVLKLFLICCNNLCSLPQNVAHSQYVEAGNSILRNFKQLVETHFTDWHSTSQYAEALSITPDHLNRTIKSLIGKTAKEYIQARITTSAKRMLFFSDLSTKEIGYSLGFQEPAHFSAFFKKCTGESPSSYKKNS